MKFFNQLDQPIVKKHFFITILGIILGLLLYYYFEASQVTEDGESNPMKIILSVFSGVLVAYSCYFISRKLDAIIPWRVQLANRFLLGIIFNFLASLAIIIILVVLYKKIAQINLAESYESALVKLSIILFMIMLVYNIIHFALYSYYTYVKLQIDSIAYDRKQIDLQLKALKSQLSSHFLFNNLNTISSLVYKNSKTAEEYIRNLANIYSYTLNSYNSKLVSLKEELNLVSSYLLLIETRFGKAFDYNISIPDVLLDSKIPPLTLQMLVENSVKHNQMDTEHKLKIDISTDGHFISVKNNITQSPKSITSFNIGLKNIEARYQLLSNSQIHVTQGLDFEVKFPVLA
ncbi:putative two-component system sensor protein histidine kinase [Flavobacteriales bacterium ALC-1]|nr:putative two-component system sensor protein histidine kinase [Flavobacteriales bacterium ALC-1]